MAVTSAPEGFARDDESGPWRSHWQIGHGYVTSKDEHEEHRIVVVGPFIGGPSGSLYAVMCETCRLAGVKLHPSWVPQ